MFWKKKKKIDLEFPSDFSDHRSAFRVKPDQTNPIILSVAGNSYHVVNVSGTGCRLASPDRDIAQQRERVRNRPRLC